MHYFRKPYVHCAEFLWQWLLPCGVVVQGANPLKSTSSRNQMERATPSSWVWRPHFVSSGYLFSSIIPLRERDDAV